jgi:hypothetical protein
MPPQAGRRPEDTRVSREKDMPTDVQPKTLDDDDATNALIGAWAELLIVDYRRRHSEVIQQEHSPDTEAYDRNEESETHSWH